VFPAAGPTAFVGGLVALVALTGCVADQTGTTASDADVPPPAIAVTGDPAAISGASDGIADDASGIDTVVMIGDSITKGATPALDERYELLGLDHLIEAQNGKRIAVSSPDNASGVSIARFVAENGDGDHSDEVWVVALGTNDVGQYASPDEIAAVVNEILAAVPDDAALVWVDIYFRDRAEAAAEFNAIVRDRVARRGDSVIAPWSSFAPSEGVLTGDGVHPTSDGADVFAFVVTDTVRAFLGR
jgi:lysophospholipase L1-like esterase